MTVMRTTVLSSLMAFVLFTAACAGGETEQTADTTQVTPGATAQEATQEMPDTSASEIWAFLQETNYRDNWDMWPGKTAFYEGTEPHGMLLSTYVNGLALDAVTNAAGSMPDGAAIIKDNYMPDSTLASVTVMHKVEGYNPQHNNWYWAKYGPDGTVQASGQAEGCQNCHGAEADNDYVMTASLSGM